MDGVFDLGTFEESARTAEPVRRHFFEVEGHSSLFVGVSGDLALDVTFVGLSVPLETLAGSIFVENGVPALAAGARVEARCDAVPAVGRPPLEVSRSLPVHVKVELAEYEPLEFDWRPDGPAEVRRMVRTP